MHMHLPRKIYLLISVHRIYNIFVLQVKISVESFGCLGSEVGTSTVLGLSFNISKKHTGKKIFPHNLLFTDRFSLLQLQKQTKKKKPSTSWNTFMAEILLLKNAYLT